MNRIRFWTGKIKPLRNAGLVIAWINLAVLLPLTAAGCSNKEASASGEQSPLVEVGIINPQRKDMTREINQPGQLRPYYLTPIYTKIAGFAKDPKYDIGDRVEKGKLLVELFVPEVDQELNVTAAKVRQAKADLLQSKQAALAAKAGRDAARADTQAKLASIRSAKAEVERWKAEEVRSKMLMKKGVYDQQTADEATNQLRASEAFRDEAEAKWMSASASFDQSVARFHKAEADVDVAEASVAVAQATHAQKRDWLAYAQITAPYSGLVTLRNVDSGDFFQPSTSGPMGKGPPPLFVMMKTDIMRCCVDVPELDALLVKEGDDALIRFQALPGVETVGKVTRFSSALDDKSRTLRLEVHLKNDDNKLLAGMYANVTIMAKLRGAWTLPPDAVMSDILANGDRSYCFVVENGKARKVFLQIGARGNEGLQILRKQQADSETWESMTGAEAVVVINNKALQDGQAVQVRTSASR